MGSVKSALGMEMAKRVREIRVSKLMTQKAFAEKIDVPKSTLANMESRLSMPPGEIFEGIARVWPELIRYVLMGDANNWPSQSIPQGAPQQTPVDDDLGMGPG